MALSTSYIATIFFRKAVYLYYILHNSALLFTSQAVNNTNIGFSDSIGSYTTPINSEINLFVRLIFALAIVIILLILTLWVLKHILRLRVSGIADDVIDVLAIRYIEQKKAVALIRVFKRVFIIGIAENSISSLGELSPEEIGSIKLDKKTEPGVFRNILSKLPGKKSNNW